MLLIEREKTIERVTSSDWEVEAWCSLLIINGSTMDASLFLCAVANSPPANVSKT